MTLYEKLMAEYGHDYAHRVYGLAWASRHRMFRTSWSEGSRQRMAADEPTLVDDLASLIVAHHQHDGGTLEEAANRAGSEKQAELYAAYSKHPPQKGPSRVEASAVLGRWGKVLRVDPLAELVPAVSRTDRRPDGMPQGFAFTYPEHDLEKGGATGTSDPLMRQALENVLAEASPTMRRRVEMMGAGLPPSQVAVMEGVSYHSAFDSFYRFRKQVRAEHERLSMVAERGSNG